MRSKGKIITEKRSKMKNKSNFPIAQCLFLLIGEIIVSLIVCLIYFIIQKFTYKVVTGVALGSVVTVLNFLFLAISTGRVFDKAEEARGKGEMSEEEIESFVTEYKRQYENMTRVSYIVRNLTMIATLIVAFLVDQFDVIATLVPLLMFRPLITLQALITEKNGKDKD